MPSSASLSLIQSLYVSYYGRPADPEGLEFWANVLEANGGDVQAVLTDFGTSPEYTERFGGMSKQTLVNNLYQQLFGRDADAEGLSFYTDLLANGQQSLAQIAHTIGSIASGVDRQVLDGRTQVANAFTRQLDSDEEIAAYGTNRGIEIGKAYLQEVNASTGATPAIGKVVDVVATLLPSAPPPTPGGGGVVTPAAPTFEVKIEGDVLSFTGTQTGEITVELNGSDVIFGRGGLTDILSATDFQTIASIVIGENSVAAPASVFDGLAVSGTGSLRLDDVAATLDLTGLAAGLNVTAHLSQDLDLTQAPGISGVDAFVLGEGGTITLSAAQYGSVIIEGGSYVLQDDASALLSLATATLAGAKLVEVEGEPSLTDLQDLVNTGATVSYHTVAGTAAELQDEAENGQLLAAASKIVVTDESSISELQSVKGVVAQGTVVVARSLTDSVDMLIVDGAAHPFIEVGTNVTVTGYATVAQMIILDDANGEGELSYSLQDSFANVWPAANLRDSAEAIELTSLSLGAVTVAQVSWLLDPANKVSNVTALSDLTFDLLDSFAALASPEAADIVNQADEVTASHTLAASQAVTLHSLYADAIYDVRDSAYNLANGDESAIIAARDLIATTVAIASEAQVIQSRDGATGEVTYDVADTYANLIANAAGSNAARNLSVNWSGYLDTTQATNIVALTNSGITSAGSIQDSAANINNFVQANQENETLNYSFYVWDTASNILTQLASATDGSQLYFAKGNATAEMGDQSVGSIRVQGSFDVAGAKTFWDAIDPVFGDASTTAQKTEYYISDTLTNYSNEAAAHLGVIYADGRVISGTAADFHTAQNSYSSDNHNIFNVLASHGTSSDRLVVSGSDGYQAITGSAGNDSISGGNDNDMLSGSAGSDTLYGDAGNDVIYGGSGNDTIYGGTERDSLYGQDGRDTIYAGNAAADTGTYYYGIPTNQVYGGNGGDNLFGSSDYDTFVFASADRAGLRAESGTLASTRDYITNFSQGDKITFEGVQTLQFLGTASGNNASPVEAGTLGLSIRYDKGLNVQNWGETGTVSATLVSIDIADANGDFDNVADMHIVLVGNIDINTDGQNSITFGA